MAYIHDLEPDQDSDAPLLNRLPPPVELPRADLHKHLRHFAFFPALEHLLLRSVNGQGWGLLPLAASEVGERDWLAAVRD